MKKLIVRERIRLGIQLACTALVNGYAAGFRKGTIFTGKSKILCVPVLNCYSCPGALGACPIGALQAVAGGAGHRISFYVLGTLMLFGAVFGRLICGFLCPFGMVQDLLARIPVSKWHVPRRADRLLRYLKYLVFLVLVLLLPMLLTNAFGTGAPYFCKWLCPAGTLEAGLPLTAMNRSLRAMTGWLFRWKVGVLIVILGLCVLIRRPFCRYLCPLGAFYGLFNRFSLFQMHLEENACIRCGKCEEVCPMDLKIFPEAEGEKAGLKKEQTTAFRSAECIRCGRCQAACPAGAVYGTPDFLKVARSGRKRNEETTPCGRGNR